MANTRNDGYGGAIEGRCASRVEIAASVRANWPSGKPLFFRLSCVDWRKDLDDRKDGWTIEDSFGPIPRVAELRGGFDRLFVRRDPARIR